MGVKIGLIMGDSLESTKATATGFELLPITEKAAKEFGIKREERGAHWPTWEVVKNHFGRYPDWWFATECPSGPPWNKKPKDWEKLDHGLLYEELGAPMSELPRIEKKAVSCRILSVESEPAVFASRSYRKPSKWADHADFTVELSQTESVSHSRSSSSSWSMEASTTVGVEIGGEASQVKAKVETTVSFGYSQETTREQSATSEVSVSDSVSTGFGPDTPPNAALIASLQGSKGKIIVEVEYVCRLVGSGIVWYEQKHLNGRKAHFLSLETLLKDLGQPTERRIKDTLDLGFVSDGMIIVSDGIVKPDGRVVPV